MGVVVAMISSPPEASFCIAAVPSQARTNWNHRLVLNEACEKYRWKPAVMANIRIRKSGRVDGIAPVHPPTPPDVRFSASGG